MMARITYENQNGRHNSRNVPQWDIDVLIDGNRSGIIKLMKTGYVYLPKGAKKYAGEPFGTLDALKRSLETD